MYSTSIHKLTDGVFNAEDLLKLCVNLEWTVGFFGGRRLRHKMQSVEGTLCINDLVKVLDTVVAKSNEKDVRASLDKIRNLDQQGTDVLVRQANFIQKIFTFFKQRIGNYGYDRHRILARIDSAIVRKENEQALPLLSSPYALAPRIVPLKPAVPIPPLTVEQKAFLDRNPFIHGTSSSVFALMPKTEQKLLPTWQLLQKGMAPMSGELWVGGMDRIVTDNPVRFGRVQNCSYDLHRVLEYAQASPTTFTREQILSDFLQARKYGYLTLMLVFANRALQMGISLCDEQEQKILQEENQKMRTYLRNYYLGLPFIAKFVVEKYKHVDISSFVKTFLDAAEGVNLQKYANAKTLPMSDQAIQKMKKDLEQEGYTLQEKARKIKPSSTSKRWEHLVHSSLFSVSNASVSLSNALDDFDGALSAIPMMKKEFAKHLQTIDEHFKLLNNALFSSNNKPLEIPAEERVFLDNPFGVVFLCDENSKQTMTILKSGEYASEGPVELGVHIKMIAVEAEHIGKVQTYLQRYGIEHVQVIAREALENGYKKQ